MDSYKYIYIKDPIHADTIKTDEPNVVSQYSVIKGKKRNANSLSWISTRGLANISIVNSLCT